MANFLILAIFSQKKKTKHERMILKGFSWPIFLRKKNEKNSPNLNLGEIFVIFSHKILAILFRIYAKKF